MAKSSSLNIFSSLLNKKSSEERSQNGIITPNGGVQNKADDTKEKKIDKVFDQLKALSGSVSDLVGQLSDKMKSDNKKASKVTGEDTSIDDKDLKDSIQPLQDMIAGSLGIFTGSNNLNGKIKDGSLKASNQTTTINWWKQLYKINPDNFVIDPEKLTHTTEKVESVKKEVTSKDDIQKTVEKTVKAMLDYYDSKHFNKKQSDNQKFVKNAIGRSKNLNDQRKENVLNKSKSDIKILINGDPELFKNLADVFNTDFFKSNDENQKIDDKVKECVDTFNSMVKNLNDIQDVDTKKVRDNLQSIKDFYISDSQKNKSLSLIGTIKAIQGQISHMEPIKKEVIGNMKPIAEMLASIAQVGMFNASVENGSKETLKNLKLLKEITSSENLGTKLHLNNRGLIIKILNNVVKIGEEAKGITGAKQINELKQLFYELSSLGDTADLKAFNDLNKYCIMMTRYFAEGSVLDDMIKQYKDFYVRFLKENKELLNSKNIDKVTKGIQAPFVTLDNAMSGDLANKSFMSFVISKLGVFKLMSSLYEPKGSLFKMLQAYNIFYNKISGYKDYDVQTVKSVLAAPFASLEGLGDSISKVSISGLIALYPFIKAYKYDETDIKECGVLGKLIYRFKEFATAAIIMNKESRFEEVYNALTTPLNTISSISENYDVKDIEKVTELLQGLYPLKLSVDFISKWFDDNYVKMFDTAEANLEVVLTGIGLLAMEIARISKESDVNSASELSKSCADMMHNLCNIASIAVASSGDIDPAMKAIDNLIGEKDSSFLESLKKLVQKVSEINFKDFETGNKNVEMSIDLLKNLSKVMTIASASSIFVKIGTKSLARMDSGVEYLKPIVDKFTEIDSGDIDKATANAKSFAILVGISSLMMLAACGAAALIVTQFVPLMLFTVALSAFIFGVLGAYKLSSKNIDDAGLNAEKFAKVVVASAAVMLIGGLIMTAKPEIVLGALLFAVSLGAFMLAVITAYKFGTKGLEETMKQADQFLAIMVVCAGTMLIGSMCMSLGVAASAIGFGLMLALFMVGMAGVFKLVSMITNGETMQSMDQFAILMGASTLVMMVGALFMKSGLAWEAIKFGGVLSIFMIMVGASFALISWMAGGRALESMDNFAKLIAISAATLVIGGLVMLIPGMPDAIMSFAFTLGGFMLAVGISMGIAGRLLGKKGLANMIGIAVVVLVAGGILLAAGMMYIENPGLQDAVEGFRTTTLSLIVGMAAICWLLGKKKKDIAMGEACVGGIIALVWLIGKAMNSVVSVIDAIGGRWDEMDKMLERTAVIFGSVLGVVVAIAVAVGLPGIGQAVATALGIAEGIVAGVVAIIWEIGKAMKSIAEAGNAFADMKPIDFELVEYNLVKMAGIGLTMGATFNAITGAVIMSAIPTILALSNALAKIAETSQMMANLTMPIYDDNGKLIGKRVLTSEDLAKSSENIALVITNLGGAIKKLYDDDKNGIFGNWANSLFNVDTPFTRVVKSCMNMGNMISEIAGGVKEMAELRVPVWTNGKQTGYRALKEGDFKLASTNIASIVTTIGGAIVDLYTGKAKGVDQNVIKEMFATEGLSGWLGTGKATNNTIFGRTIIAFTAMGKMIGEIGKGLKEMADLKIPIYTGTKVTGYHTMADSDFQTARDNIQKIIVCLASAMSTAYENNPTLFNDPSKWYEPGNKAPLAMMIKSFSGIGKVISEMVTAIKAVSDLRIQKYDSSGRPIKGQFDKIDVAELAKNVKGKNGWHKGKLYNVLFRISTAFPYILNEVYENNKPAFDENQKGIEAVKKSVNGVNEMIKTVLGAIDQVKKAGLDDDTITEVRATICQMMQIVPNAISQAYYQNDNKGVYEAMKAQQDDLVKNLKSRAELLSNTLPFIFKAHQDILKNIPTKKFNDVNTENLKANLSAVIGLLPDAFKELTKEDHSIDFFNDDFKAKISGFLQYYKNFKDVLSEEVKFDKTQAESLIDTVYQVNNKINAIDNKKVDAFSKESTSMRYFSQSINTLDASKTSQMIELISTINKMAENIGGLDKFTKTLANDLATVLRHLTQQLKNSAVVIDKAEKIQKKRHENIERSIKEVNTILNNPVEVIVSQKQEEVKDDNQDNNSGGLNSYDQSSSPASGRSTFNPGHSSSSSSMERDTTSAFIATMKRLFGEPNNDQGANATSAKPTQGRGSTTKA